jgi:6-phosphogluconolactonase (cycloisomerase 2 family)
MSNAVYAASSAARWTRATSTGSPGRARRAAGALAAIVASLALCAPALAANVYVVNSTAPGTISQYSVAADGKLAPLSPPTVPTVASGQGATGIAVSPDGRNVLAGNFSAGTLVRFTVNADGTLSSTPAQTLAVASVQQVRYSPDGRSAYAPRASNPGFIAQFDVAADGMLTPKSPASVSGQITPGPLAFNAAGTRAYSGQNGLSGVSQFAVAADGTLSPLSPAMVSSGGSQARVVALSPDGTSLYAPNSGSSSVSQYAVSPVDGTLTLVTQVAAGGQPRGIAISADGTSVYVANSTNDATGNSISQYTRAANGTLTPKSPATVAAGAVGTDAIVLSSDGHSAYATNQGAMGSGSQGVSQFTVESDGTLTPKTPLLVPAAPGPNQLVFSDGPQLPPTVSTGASSAVTATAAHLAGSVNPHGVATNYTFEYGTSLSFGQISPIASAGAGTADVPVSASLTGLSASTTYYYRLVASNALGTQLGAVAAFRTASPPLAFSTTPDSPTQTNGAVNAIVQSGDRTYIGGTFTRVGVPIGFGASLAPGSGAPDYSVAKPNGTVNAVVSDGAGGWFIGGLFSAVGDVPRSRLAHLLADGTVDPAFDPHMSNSSLGSSAGVRALALDGATLYAGGDFTRVGTGAAMVTRNFVAAIDVTTGAPTSFDANLTTNDQSQFATALAVSGSKLWVAGTLYANPLYKNLLAVDKTTGVVDPISETISVGPGYPYELTPHAGKLYFGGAFNTVNGVTRNYFAAIDETTGALDPTFKPDPSSGVTGIVFSGGKVYAGGNFTRVNGGTVLRSGLAAFDPITGVVDPDWNPNVRWGHFDSFTQIVTGIALSGTTLYISGSFDQVNGSVARSHLAAVDLATGTATAFDPYVDKPALAIAADGSHVYAGGYFSYAGRESIAGGVAALKPDGTLDSGFAAGITGPVAITSLVVAGDRVFAGGDFGITVDGGAGGFLVALDAASGTRIASFAPNVGGPVAALALAGAKLYVGGQFTTVNGTVPRSNLAALDTTTGVVDPAFVPDASSGVFALLSSGGALYAGGRFTTIGGAAHERLARLDLATGAADPAFTASVNDDVRALGRAGGPLYLGGSFQTVDGNARPSFAAVDAATGTLMPAFAPPNLGSIRAIAFDGDVVYAGGAAYDPTTGAIGVVPVADFGGASALLVTAGHLYVGGGFSTVNGTSQRSLAHFPRAALPAPVAVTGAASAVRTTGADVAGQVNPRGQQTATTFEYGTSPSFGTISPVIALDDADALEPVAASLTGLSPGTTYYYRLVATNASGTTFGAVASFTTAPGSLAPLAITGGASGVSATGATLSAAVDPQGSATAFTFEYGTTNDFGSISAVDSAGSASASQPVSLPITGLTPGTEYRYRIVATNANGTTAGAVGSFTTAP